VQGQRYTAGQQFRMHNDYFAGGQPYSEAVAREGGQRTWTAMIFLNKPSSGGCTHFPRAQVKVEPEPGALLTWNNNDRQGLSNPYSHHEGMVVETGVKYVLTKWFREREWLGSDESDALRA
jgi:prolyl 4-hydroxylase